MLVLVMLVLVVFVIADASREGRFDGRRRLATACLGDEGEQGGAVAQSRERGPHGLALGLVPRTMLESENVRGRCLEGDNEIVVVQDDIQAGRTVFMGIELARFVGDGQARGKADHGDAQGQGSGRDGVHGGFGP